MYYAIIYLVSFVLFVSMAGALIYAKSENDDEKAFEIIKDFGVIKANLFIFGMPALVSAYYYFLSA
jgi:hypothetical protein